MDGADLVDRSDLDTWLARLLLAQGRLPLQLLRELLREARAHRGAGGPSLARSLVARGWITAPEVAALLREGAVAPTHAPGATRPPRAAPARRLGEYELLDTLGAGGMGTVYRARHIDSGAVRALKTLVAADPELLARFQREGEGQARVDDHPHIVRVHTLGRDGATWFLVMDLVEGGSLARRLREALPPPDVAARWVRDLALAVEHAHSRGVLHRDLKPDNVLFDGEVPKLVDFGLAKLVDARSLTATGTVLGTPAYMAPEQVDGARGGVSVATDVYGLGGVLYACLTGRAPFEGGSMLQIMLQALEEPPVPPRALRPEVPAALEAVCLRALEKDPARRFTSAAALAEALEDALAQRRDEPARSMRVPLLAAVAAALAASAGTLAPRFGAARDEAGEQGTLRSGERPPAPPRRPLDATSLQVEAAAPVAAPRGPGKEWIEGPVMDDVQARIDRAEALVRSSQRVPPEEGRELLEQAEAILRELVAAPPSRSHGRVYRELAGVHLQRKQEREAISWLARAALVGECESALLLGVIALEKNVRPEPYDGGFSLDLPELGPPIIRADPRDRDAFAAACFVLATKLVDAEGSVVRRSPFDEALVDRARRYLAACEARGAVAPTYARAYGRVWDAFPAARPGAR